MSGNALRSPRVTRSLIEQPRSSWEVQLVTHSQLCRGLALDPSHCPGAELLPVPQPHGKARGTSRALLEQRVFAGDCVEVSELQLGTDALPLPLFTFIS